MNNIGLKRKIVNGLIKSLNENYKDWEFNYFTAINNKTGVEIWIADTPIIDLYVYEPMKIYFNIIDKFRIYKALNNCKNSLILDILNNNDNI
jgi:hypothetical protein